MTGNFDSIIMNPPYDGNLHLKIFSNVNSSFPDAEIVNLSPILRLQLPDNTIIEDYKLSISSLERIDKESAREYFSNRIPADLGIYTLSKNGDLRPDCFELRGYNKEICNRLLAAIKQHDSFKNHIIVNAPLQRFSVCYSHMNGLSENSHNFVYENGVGPDGKSYRDNVKNQHKNDFPRSHFEFDTYEEAENFRKYLFLPTFKLIEEITQPGLLRDFSLLPYLDYAHEWDDEKLRNEFDITEEDVKNIKK